MEERMTVGVNNKEWEVLHPDYEKYLINLVKGYRTTYDMFAVVGDKVVGSDYSGFFYIEIGPIQNITNISYGFTLRTIEKQIELVPFDIAYVKLINLYTKLYTEYMNYPPIYSNRNMIEEESFMNINNHKSGIKAGLFSLKDEDVTVLSAMNGTYIKINKDDTLTVNIYQNQLMQIEHKQFFEYILHKKKSNLDIKLCTLQLALD